MPVTSFVRKVSMNFVELAVPASPVTDFISLIIYIIREHPHADSAARLYALATIQRRMLMGNKPPGRVLKIFVIVEQGQIVFPFLTG